VQLDENILNYTMSTMRGVLSPMEKAVLNVLYLVLTAVQRTLPRTGLYSYVCEYVSIFAHTNTHMNAYMYNIYMYIYIEMYVSKNA